MFVARTTVTALAAAILLAGCATGFGGPMRQLGPHTYVVSHSMGKYSPVKGVRQGVTDRAIAKCEGQGAIYRKLREEMGMEGSLSYNLIFECQPATSK
jgi:hypothetical protein